MRKYIQTIDGFKSVTIIERENKWGFFNSITNNGLTNIKLEIIKNMKIKLIIG